MMESNETQQLQAPETSDAQATQMMDAPQAQATQMAVSVNCPVCKTDNPPGEEYCVDCGFLLCSTPVEVEAPAAAAPAKLVERTSGREFPLKAGENTVGRQSADVLLTDGTVSRTHAKITISGGRCMTEDLGSSNGTFVDGRQIGAGEQVELASGAEIKFGSAVLLLELVELPAEEAEARVETEAPEEDAEVQPEHVEEGSCEDATPAEAEEAAPAEAAPQQVLGRLVGLDEELEFEIPAGENTVGRRSENSIQIVNPYVSGSHAVLFGEESGCRITDLGSTNGTLVNGDRLAANEPVELHAGDEITFGQIRFRLEWSGPQTPSTLTGEGGGEG